LFDLVYVYTATRGWAGLNLGRSEIKAGSGISAS